MTSGSGQDTRNKLREELLRVQLESLKLSVEQMRQRIDARVDTIHGEQQEHEKRIRIVEEVAIKFNFIIYLAMGGGLIGLINLAVLLFNR